jgi:hypothetical protein
MGRRTGMNMVYAETCQNKTKRDMTPNWTTSTKMQVWNLIPAANPGSAYEFRLRMNGMGCLALDRTNTKGAAVSLELESLAINLAQLIDL